MVSIYTVSDKALMGKQINILSSYIAECFFKNNIKISKQCTLSSIANFDSAINCDEDEKVYLFLVDRANLQLNEYICSKTNSVIIDNPYLKNAIYDYYRKLGQPVEKESENEWKVSSLARAILNNSGLMQGYLLEYNNTIYCVLPSYYEEARQMFDDVVLDFIISNQKKKYKSYTFKTFGLTENVISKVIFEEIKNKEKVTVNLFSKPLEVDIVIKSLVNNEELDKIAQKILIKLDKYIYSVEDIPIEKVVYNLLKLNEIKVSFVEDITSGELCCRLVKQSKDAKNYIDNSLIVLNKQSKIKYLSLTEKDLENDNGISPNVAYELTAQMLKQTSANVVVSAIGNFEENGNLPYGLCYIAVGDRREIHVYKNIFKGNLQDLIDSVAVASYFYLIKKLKKNDFHFEQTTV